VGFFFVTLLNIFWRIFIEANFDNPSVFGSDMDRTLVTVFWSLMRYTYCRSSVRL